MKISPIRIVLVLAYACVCVMLLGLYSLLASYIYLEPSLPSAANMRSVPFQVPLRVYSRSGQLIAQIGEQRRVPVAYEDIPELVRDAFVAAEDERFFEHHGFDYLGVLRAVYANLVSGEFSQGASTITMQAARNIFLTFDKTLKRKLQEVFVTYRMEHEFTKPQILNTYLNVIFFGQRAYGVAAAAEAYFGKPLAELSVAEAATLAGIPKAPSRYNPVINPKAAAGRRHYVLTRMERLKFIDESTAERADREPIDARDHPPLYEVEAPFVAEMARADLIARYGPNAVNAGYRVYTTIDGRLQTAANRAVRIGLIEYDRRHGYRGPLRQMPIAANASPAQLDKLLADVPEIATLHAAVVVSVAPMAARVYVRSMGFAQINWDGLSWARKRLSETRVGNTPKHADDVVQHGDVVYVVTNGQGMAQLAQLPEAQGALVALDPNDGAISALVGGFDYYGNEFNRVTQARRQPGSGFKPFLYSAALEHGFTPATMLMDAPIVYDESTGQEKSWRPVNDTKDFGGPTRMREGLVHSLNLVTIRLLRQVGFDDAVSYVTRFGFNPDDLPKNLTLALGTLPATPLQLVTGYATFANGGYRVSPYFVDRIENASGVQVYRATPKTVCESCDTAPADAITAPPPGAAPPDGNAAAPTTPGAPTVTSTSLTTNDAAAAPSAGATAADATLAPIGPAPVDFSGALSGADTDSVGVESATPLIPAAQRAERIISADNAWLMDDIMADVIREGTGQRAKVLGRRDIAGKTGTTQDVHDTWFNGFNRNVVATAWVGFDQERPLGDAEEGSRTALPIWIDFMREALRGTPDIPRPLPPGLVSARISPTTGLLAGTNDSNAIDETFMEGHLPAQASATGPSGAAQTGAGEPLF